MEKNNCYENYPFSTVLLSMLFESLIYASGAFIMYILSPWAMLVYLLFLGYSQYSLFKNSCSNCYNYGKICFSGKGKIAALFFKKGDPDAFTNKKITPLDLIPDMLLSFVPVITAIYLMIRSFNFAILTALIILLLLTFWGNAFIRSRLACPNCHQRELGCPAERMFKGVK